MMKTQPKRMFSPIPIIRGRNQTSASGKSTFIIVLLVLLCIALLCLHRIYMVNRKNLKNETDYAQKLTFVQKKQSNPLPPVIPEKQPPEEQEEKPLSPTKRNFLEADEAITYSDEDFSKSLLGRKNLPIHSELIWPMLKNSALEGVVVPPSEQTSEQTVVLNILKEKKAPLYSMIPITHFSSYPLPKTQNDLFENLAKDPKLISTVADMCKQRAFNEWPFPFRVYLDNSSLNLKWMFCRNEFLETKKTNTLTELHPCADFMFIARASHVHITRSFCREYCMTWRDKSMNKYYHNQPWFNSPVSDDSQPIVLEKAAYAFVSPYIEAFGHFSSETLYYIVYLLRILPEDVKILACSKPVCMQYYQYLYQLPGDPFKLNLNEVDVQKRRIIPLVAAQNSYYIKELYAPSSFPACQDEATKIYSRESVLMTQEAFLKPFYAEQAANSSHTRHILVIDRSDAVWRTLTNHAALVADLKNRFPNETVVEFLATNVSDLKDVISLFFYAKLIVAPHGAGLTHLLWCQPGTKVVEIGFDGGEFPFPSAYYGLSVAARLDYYMIIGKGSLLGKWLEAPIPGTLKLADRAITDFNQKFKANGMQDLSENTRTEMIWSFKRLVSKYANLLEEHPQNKILFNNLLAKLELPTLEEKKKQLQAQGVRMPNQAIRATHYIMDISSFFHANGNYKKIFLLRQIVLGLIRRQIEEKIEFFSKNPSTTPKNTLFLTLLTQDPGITTTWILREYKQYFEDLPHQFNQHSDLIQSLMPKFINFSPLDHNNRIRLFIKNTPDINFVLRNIQIRDSQYLPSNFDVHYSIINFDTDSAAGPFANEFAPNSLKTLSKNPINYISFAEECSEDELNGTKHEQRANIFSNSTFIFTFSKKLVNNCLKPVYSVPDSKIIQTDAELFGVGTIFKLLSDTEIQEMMKTFIQMKKPFFLATSCKSHTWTTFEKVIANMQMTEGHQFDYHLMNCYRGGVPDKFVFPIINHNQMGLMFTKSWALVDFSAEDINLSIQECIASGNPVILDKAMEKDPFFAIQNGKKRLPKGIYFVGKNDENGIIRVVNEVKSLTRDQRKEMALGLFEFINAKKLSFVNMISNLFSELHKRQIGA